MIFISDKKIKTTVYLFFELCNRKTIGTSDHYFIFTIIILKKHNSLSLSQHQRRYSLQFIAVSVIRNSIFLAWNNVPNYLLFQTIFYSSDMRRKTQLVLLIVENFLFQLIIVLIQHVMQIFNKDSFRLRLSITNYFRSQINLQKLFDWAVQEIVSKVPLGQ